MYRAVLPKAVLPPGLSLESRSLFSISPPVCCFNSNFFLYNSWSTITDQSGHSSSPTNRQDVLRTQVLHQSPHRRTEAAAATLQQRRALDERSVMPLHRLHAGMRTATTLVVLLPSFSHRSIHQKYSPPSLFCPFHAWQFHDGGGRQKQRWRTPGLDCFFCPDPAIKTQPQLQSPITPPPQPVSPASTATAKLTRQFIVRIAKSNLPECSYL